MSGLTFTRITPFAALDSNNSCNSGPNAMYLQVNVTNTSGSTLTGLTATFNGFTNPAFGGSWSTTPVSQFQLDAEEVTTRSIPTIANGATVRLYYFINYPCWSGGGAPPAQTATYTLTVSDGVTTPQTSGALNITTRSELSANAGGEMISQTIGAGAALGQIVPVTVVYEFGNVGSGNDLGIQPAGNRSHHSGCYQLVGNDVTSVTGVTGITTADDNTLYKTGVSSGGGTNRITVVYFFKAVSTACASGTVINPFADMVSGTQEKYSGNFGTCSSTPCTLTSPSPTNVLTLTKSVSPPSLPTGGTATYTVTITNPSTFATTLDSLTDVLPAGVTFGALTGGSQIVSGNSAILPAAGASGTIQFVAKDVSTCPLLPALSCTWVVPANGTLTLQYTVNVPNVVGSYTNSIAGRIGAEQIDTTIPTADNSPATSTVTVGTAPTVAKSFSPNPIAAGGMSTLTITLSNPNASALTGVSFTDTLPSSPAQMTVAGSPASPQCGGTITNTATSVTLTNGTIPGGSPGTCTIVLNVTVPSAGSYLNSIPVGGVTTASGLSNTAAGNATLVALSPPDLSLTKSDGGASVAPGGTVAYTLSYANAAGGFGAAGVTITETVPANTTFNAGASTAGWVCAPNNNAGSTCTFPVGAVAAGAGGSVTFAVTATDPLPAGVTQIANTATIADNGANGTDPTPGNNSASDTTPTTGAPDLSVTKSDSGSSVAPGGTVSYTLTYSNTGNRGATGVVLTETVPANTTFNAGASTGGWVCAPNNNAGSTCTLAVGGVAALGGGSATFAVTVSNPLPAGVTQIANTSTIADDGTNGTDPTPGNNSGSDTTPVTGAPDLSVTKSDGGSSAAPGGTVSYTLTYSNTGNRGATGVVLTETVPANTTFNAGASTAGWVCAPNNNAGSTCTLAVGGVAAAGGGSATFAVTVTSPLPAGVTQIANTATIADDGANGTDPTPGNNTGSDTTPVTGAPDLSVTKSDSGASVAPGGTVAYTLTYSNTGNRGATGVVLAETVPANTTFNAGASTAGWVCAPNNNAGSTCTLAVGGVAAAGGGSATFAVTVTNPLPAGVTQIANTATIADDGTNGTDPTPGNNSGSDTTPVTGAPDLSVTKSDGGASATPGGTVSYTLTYSNTGNRGATGVVLTETVPANTTFNSGASTAGWVCAPNNNAGSTCTLAVGGVAAAGGGSATFAVTVSNPLPAGVTQISNTSTIADDGTNGTDPTPGNNSGSDTTPVTGAPDLSVTKSDGGSSAAPGGTVSYTLTYSNTGNRGATGVVLTETVPANTTFNAGASTAGWVCAPNNNAGSTCTLAVGGVAAAGGGSATFAVTVTNPLPAGVTQIANTAMIADDGANGTDPTPGNNTGSDTTPVTGAPDLTVTKSDGGSSVAPGGTVSYTLTYSNTGNRGATGVVLSETVPANTTFNSGASTAGWVCAPNNNAGSTCTLAVGGVSAGGGGSATFAVTVADPLAAGVTQIANTATIADDGANGTDPTPANNSGNDTTPVTGAPDLSVTKTDGGSSVAPGGTITYTLTYGNSGNRGATGVVLTETVPANTTFNAGASTAGWSCSPNNNAGSTCTLAVGSIAAAGGGSATFAVTVADPLAAGVTQIANTATIADDGANGTDPTPGDNSGSDTTPVTGAPDLSVTKSDGGASVVPGGTATYTLTYANAGNRGATGVVLTETVPTNTTFNAGASTAGWSCTPNNNAGSTCTLAVGSVAAGVSNQTATFAVTVDSPLPGGVTQISNTVSIADDGTNGTDPTPADNSGSDTTPVTSAPDLSITKSDGGASVAPGGTVSYTLTYSNTGTIGATGVVLTETVPANTTFNAGASTAGWSCTPDNNAGSTCTLAIGSLAAGSGNQTATFAVTVVNPLAAGVTQIANTASIADDGANGTDPTPANNSGSDTTPVTGAPDLSVTKSDGGASVAPGGTATYTLTYANAGNRGAAGVVLTETVPANTTFNAGASTAGWSCTPDNNAGSTCTLAAGSLAAGGGNQTATFAVTVVNPLAAGVTQISNTVSIADDGANGTDPTPADNSGSDTTPVTSAPDLSITKSDGGASVAPGGTVTYTLTYSNNGTIGATGVVLTETVPVNATFNAASSTAGWSCTPDNNAGSTCTLAVGALVAGSGNQTATFAVTVDNPVPNGVKDISNTVTIEDDETNGIDPTPADNTSSDTTPVSSAPDLSITKSDGGTSVTPGGTITYTLTYSNTGSTGATGVVLTETVPANTTFNAGASTAGWSCTPDNNAGSTCTLAVGALAAGSGNQTATFAVTVDSPLPGGVTQISNTASIADDGANGTDPTPANNTSSDTTPVSAVATNLNPPAGQKTLASSIAPNLDWRMVWINNQNSSPINVRITDAIPAGTTYVPGSVTCSPQGSSTTTTCSFDSVNNRIFWEGVIGADPGAGTEAAAANELVITFRVAVDPAVDHVENQASALTDRDGDSDFSDEDPTTSVSISNRVVWDRGVAEIPTVSATGLAALFLLLAAAGWLILRRGMKPGMRGGVE